MSSPDLSHTTPMWDRPADCIVCGKPTYMLYSGVRLPDAPFDEMTFILRGMGGKETGRFVLLPPYSRETVEAYACNSCGFWILNDPS